MRSCPVLIFHGRLSAENSRKFFLTRSQSDRSFSRPIVSAGGVLFSDTMRLSLGKRIRESSPSSVIGISRDGDDESRGKELVGKQVGACDVLEEAEDREASKDEIPDEKVAENTEKEAEPPPDARSDISDTSNEHFRTMRPTDWSPPPSRQRHRFKIGDSAGDPDNNPITHHRRTISSASSTSWNSASSYGSSKIEINSPESNVCKITVSPRSSPLVHRLRIGPDSGAKATRRTSILINGDHGSAESAPSNKVTISVGGEDSVCNPTVISVNSENLPKIQSSAENRTLVILENYRSNIVVESTSEESRSKQPTGRDNSRVVAEDNAGINSRTNDGGQPVSINGEKEACQHAEPTSPEKPKRSSVEIKSFGVNQSPRFCTPDEKTTTRPESKARPREQHANDGGSFKSFGLSKEALISKLLEDSLRKARENGEILDEDSGQAILKILKQSLLKSKEYESSESTIDANYSRSSSLNSDSDFVSTNLFLEENPYEVIKEPIYEEIPDEPPPLPLSPPPTEDYIKDRIYFGDVEYYKKVAPGQFLGPFLSEEVFKKSNSEDLAKTYLSKSPEDFFKKMSASPEDDSNISTKFELLNFLMDSKDRTRPAEEDDDEDEDEEEDDAEGDLEALYEQKETSLGDLSSKSSQISNVSDSSEECNIILTNSPEALKVSLEFSLDRNFRRNVGTKGSPSTKIFVTCLVQVVF